jgi:hypothetical protein
MFQGLLKTWKPALKKYWLKITFEKGKINSSKERE